MSRICKLNRYMSIGFLGILIGIGLLGGCAKKKMELPPAQVIVDRKMIISETGTLHYDTDEAFNEEWRESLAPASVNVGRWAVVDTGEQNRIVLRAGGTGNTTTPCEHRVYDVAEGEALSVFDVSGVGSQSAFRAFTDFKLVSGPKRAMEAMRVNLAVVSADGSTSYTASLYANAGNKMFTQTSLRIDKINFNTGENTHKIRGRARALAYVASGITFKPGAWYRLELAMTRKLLGDRSPVDLEMSVYELAGGVKGGARGDILKSISAPMMPNLGKHVQFGMIGSTAGSYTIYLDNFGAEAKPVAGQIAKITARPPMSEATKAMVKYLMDRKHEYKKEKGILTLASGGKQKMVIVVPADAPAPVRYAGKELKIFLDKITGGNFQIVTKVPANGKAIILGDSLQAREAGIDVSKIARDGYRIIAKDNNIIIAGRDDATEKSELLFRFMKAPDSQAKGILYKTLIGELWDFHRGTLYGTYRLLEELGVRWFMPGPKGMVIPPEKDLKISAFSMLEEPVFDMRRVGPTVWSAPRCIAPYSKSPKTDFMACYRDLKWSPKENRLWLLRMRGSTMIYPMNHRVYDNFEGRFGEEHPEYFALYRGKRDIKSLGATGRTGLPCFSSEGRLRETIKDVDAFFAGKPTTARDIPYYYPSNRGWSAGSDYGNVVSMMPHDAFKPCGCELCKPRIALGRSGGELSEVVWDFTSKVAEHVQKRWPGKMVFNLAYSTYSALPLTLDRLPDNVLVGVARADWFHSSMITDPKVYEDAFTSIREWNEMSALPMGFWLYHLYRCSMNTEHYAVPMLLPHFYGRYIKDLSKCGRFMLMQMERDNYMYVHLNRYVLLKLLYNPDLDVDALIDDYAKKFYGPAADIMKSMLLDIEKRSERVAATGAARGEIWSKGDLFNGDVVKRYRQKADEAVKLTAGTPYAEAARLFSIHFIGFMEQGYKSYRAVASEDKDRVGLLRERKNMTINLPYSEDSNNALSMDLMGASSFPGFQKSSVKLSRDDKYLNINLIAHERKITKLSAKCKINNQGTIWSDDSFEIMLVPPGSEAYYQIIINSLGTYSIINAGKETDRHKLIAASKLKLEVIPDIVYDACTWGGKVKIPLSQFPAADFKKPWRINVFRNRRIDEPSAHQWSGIYLSKINYHILNEYPKLNWPKK